MAGTPISGKNARVQVNGTTLNMAEFTIDEQATEIEGYNFESGGYDETTFGKLVVNVTVRGMWDAGANPHANPPNLNPGVTAVNLYIYTSTIYNTTPWIFPLFNIFSGRSSGQADGRIEFEFSGKSSGSFSRPT